MSRQRELDAIELALANARMYAEIINDSVIEYFIRMAIAEVRARHSQEQRSALPE